MRWADKPLAASVVSRIAPRMPFSLRLLRCCLRSGLRRGAGPYTFRSTSELWLRLSLRLRRGLRLPRPSSLPSATAVWLRLRLILRLGLDVVLLLPCLPLLPGSETSRSLALRLSLRLRTRRRLHFVVPSSLVRLTPLPPLPVIRLA